MRCDILDASLHPAAICALWTLQGGTRAEQRRAFMRRGIILAAVLTALSTTGARAGDWCGYAAHPKAAIECGYSTAAECENGIGKGATCFVDPEYALESRRSAPIFAARHWIPKAQPRWRAAT
jgi:hypothetical protein